MSFTRSLRALRRRRLDVSQDDGFTLAELLVALGIITGALFALLGGFITAASAVQAQQEDARAVRVALDRYESLRLRNWETDPELQVEANGSPRSHAGEAMGSNGILYKYVTTVSLRDAKPGEDVAGDVVKDISTVVTWVGSKGRTRDITYTTSLAQDARTIGLASGYVQAIQEMTVAPEPSVVVDENGYTTEPIYVTVVMSGFATSDVLPVTWQDSTPGTRTAQASSVDGRFWRAVIPAGSSGIYVTGASPGVSRTLTFQVTNRAGQTASSDLSVFGTPLNPPQVTSFTVNPNPIKTFNGGLNRDQNNGSVTFTCDITRMTPGPGSRDIVKVKYAGETGEVEQTLQHVSGTTYRHVFATSTTFFAPGTSHPYTCVARRGDGGYATKVTLVNVGRQA